MGVFSDNAFKITSSTPDCNNNGIPDECELVGNDCNTNSVPDECDTDCNGNGIPDGCEVWTVLYDASGGLLPESVGWVFTDENNPPSTVTVSGGTLTLDCSLTNRAYWEIELVAQQGVPSGLGVFMQSTAMVVSETHTNDDRGAGLLSVADGDGINANVVDVYAREDRIFVNDSNDQVVAIVLMNTTDAMHTYRVDLLQDQFHLFVDGNLAASGSSPLQPYPTPVLFGSFGDGSANSASVVERTWVTLGSLGDPADCNGNGTPDECELAGNDCNTNGVPDECDTDCNASGVPDDCEAFADCNGSGIPDECELVGNDCNGNSLPDECDLDCDASGVPDDCETFPDCNNNGIPDECEVGAQPITEIIDATGGGAGNTLMHPWDIAVDAAGNAYVNGMSSDNAFKITPAGVITEIIDAAGDGAGNSLDGPYGIAVDAAGNAYVTGSNSSNAFKITPAGVITEIIDAAGDDAGNILDGARRIAVDGAGNAYVAGLFSDNAFKITPGGLITEIIDAAGDSAGNGLNQPVAIAVDVSGNVYVTGDASQNAFKITPAGVITEIIDVTGDGAGNGLGGPDGIAVDAAGNVYVTGSNSNNAFEITPAGVITEIIDATGDGAGNGLGSPRGIAADAAGNVYVIGSNSNNAFKITPAGLITEVIDSTGDGAGNGFSGGWAIAVDAVGNAYVAGGSSQNAFKVRPAPDCNNNGIPDECDLVENDCNGNSVPDECETDCNTNGVPDDCEAFADCNGSGIPDECELVGNDCNSNSVPDECDADCNTNGAPDDCEVFLDCNANGIPDECDISSGSSPDLNGNGIPDECEVPPLTVDAGVNQVVTGGNAVNLNAVASDGLPPYTYVWTQVAAGNAGTAIRTTPDQQATAVVFSYDAGGTFTFQVTVTDAVLDVATDVVDVLAVPHPLIFDTLFAFTMLPIDNLTGTAGDDVFIAPIVNDGTGAGVITFQTGDAANGGAGADSVDVTFCGNNGGAPINSAPALTNIETIELYDCSTGGSPSVIDGTNITGLSKVLSSWSTTDLRLTNLQALIDVDVQGSNVDVDAVFAAGATNGGADMVILSLFDVPPTALVNRNFFTFITAANGLEILAINSTGSAANRIKQVTQTTGTTLGTLNIWGDQDLQIGAIYSEDTLASVTNLSWGGLDSSITTVDASGFTGNLGGGAEGLIVVASDVTVIGGSGDDTIMFCSRGPGGAYNGTYDSLDAFDGGGGFDTLGLLSAQAAPGAPQVNVSNIEALRIIDELTSNVALTDWGFGVTSVTLDDGADGGTITYPSGPSGINALSLGAKGIRDAGGSGILDITVGDFASTDILFILVDDCDQAGFVIIDGAEIVNLISNVNLDGAAASGGANTFGGTFLPIATDGNPATLNVTGTEDLTFFGDVPVTFINASGFTENLTMTVGTTTATVQSIVGGSGNDTLYGSWAAGNTINGGGGNDTMGTRLGTADFTGGAGNDTFEFMASQTANLITDLSVGSDAIVISSSDSHFDLGSGLAEGGGAPGSLVPMPAGSTGVLGVAQNEPGITIPGGAQFIKLMTPVANAGSDQATFNAAIGTATISGLWANTSYVGSFYDSSNGQMVVFEVASDLASPATIQTGDFIRLIVKINMSLFDYASFASLELAFQDLP